MFYPIHRVRIKYLNVVVFLQQKTNLDLDWKFAYFRHTQIFYHSSLDR